MVAKAFFLQYWSGRGYNDAIPDASLGQAGLDQNPLIFNQMNRIFYPTPNSHVIPASNDLGREAEFQAAELFAMNLQRREGLLKNDHIPICKAMNLQRREGLLKNDHIPICKESS
jgi:hypothetical protein